MSAKPWAIVGGGIAGLASALAVASAGRDIRVFEKTSAFAPIGAGLQLGPNAVRALQRLGVWEAVAPFCTSPEAIVIRDGITGQQLQRISLAEKFLQKFGAPYRVILRADLHVALQTVCAANSRIEINMAAEWGGSLGDVEALLAADGIWSELRVQHFPNAEAVILPHTIHRSLIPLPSQVAENAVTLWLYPHGHVVHYVVGDPAKLNIVCVTKSALYSRDWNNETNLEFLRQYFAKACAELHQILSHQEKWLGWPAAYVPALKNWSRKNMLLIGDAAHGTAPYLAQGAAMALEDAATLSEIMQSQSSIEKLFIDFEKLRKTRNLRHHKTAITNANIYHADGLLRLARNATMQIMPQEIFLERLAWIYKGGPK